MKNNNMYTLKIYIKGRLKKKENKEFDFIRSGLDVKIFIKGCPHYRITVLLRLNARCESLTEHLLLV